MTNKSCDGCETVAHCLKNGCVPKTTKQTEALASGASEESSGTEQPAQPQQEPYGYVSTHTGGLMHFNKTFHGVYRDTATEIVAVYTSPPASKPLTDGRISWLWGDAHNDTTDRMPFQVFARAIEAAHGIKEKNT